MAEDSNPLAAAKFSSGLFLSDFPAKIRVLTRDPMVYNDKFGNTRYAFIVYNLDEERLQILNKGPGFAQEFQRIDSDNDFGGDIRRVDVKITTNGKQGINIRYKFDVIGDPYDLSKEQMKSIMESNIKLDEVIQKNSPGAKRLSEINAGAKIGGEELEPAGAKDDIVIEDIGDEPINLDDIPF